MKIDDILAKHPWPWRIDSDDHAAAICDSNGHHVISHDNPYGQPFEALKALLELVKARVHRITAIRTHSERCWQWHLECAQAKVEELLTQAKETRP